mmetsp:Transcript_16578/g.37866  ORF Transcript_16578/g.37866 Transcript_16578/m.37866 type:complete len:254 (-) Transcript_16578:20-781(-)
MAMASHVHCIVPVVRLRALQLLPPPQYLGISEQLLEVRLQRLKHMSVREARFLLRQLSLLPFHQTQPRVLELHVVNQSSLAKGHQLLQLIFLGHHLGRLGLVVALLPQRSQHLRLASGHPLPNDADGRARLCPPANLEGDNASLPSSDEVRGFGDGHPLVNRMLVHLLQHISFAQPRARSRSPGHNFPYEDVSRLRVVLQHTSNSSSMILQLVHDQRRCYRSRPAGHSGRYRHGLGHANDTSIQPWHLSEARG